MSDDELEITSLATGGRGVARRSDGKVVFVEGALPGERIRATVVDERRSFGSAILDEIETESPSRRIPWCRHRLEGCGGCDWQHVDEAARAGFQVDLVADVLTRHAGVGVKVVHGGSVPSKRYRTTLRFGIENGAAGFRSSRSSTVVPVDVCEVGHGLLDWVGEVDWRDATEVVVRCGANTGEVMAAVAPSADMEVPAGVRLVGRDELDAGKRAWIHEEAAGRRWRLSADSFFQSGPDAAELLATTVLSLVSPSLRDGMSIADLYGGVGLFSGVVGAAVAGGRLTLVESSPSAIADARINLADLDVKIVRSKVERFGGRPHDLVIADPPRSGLGRTGVKVASRTASTNIVLVSCDVGAFGRDAALLRDAGFTCTGVEVLDLFPQTSHVEVVSLFRRG